MSIRVMSWVLDESTATGNDRLVLIAIADEADDDGRNAFPSMDRIARRARINRHTAMRAIKRLEDLGELEVTRPETTGRGHHNTYRILTGKGSEVAPFQEGRGTARKSAEGRAQERPNPQTPRPTDPTARDGALPLGASFEDWWSTYPKCPHKGAKDAARTEWQKHARDVEAVMAGLARWITYWAARDEPEYICAASKWLKEERWNVTAPAVRRIAGPPVYDDAPVRYV